ncbi:MAG: lipoyl protein ligase domain-containing protein [Acidimicrobiales bacterium]
MERRVGLASQLHRWTEMPAPGRLLRICEVLAPAVVIGSAQDRDEIDAARLHASGTGLVRRRSGGGAVFVSPASQLWIDFFVPRRDRFFESDVGRSFDWVGNAWACAIRRALGADGAVSVVERGSQGDGAFGRSLCFVQVVRGEVTLDGRKVVGCSERRDRGGAWIHTMAGLEPTFDKLAFLLATSARRRREAARALAAGSTVLPGGSACAGGVVSALLGVLAAPGPVIDGGVLYP